MNFVVVENNQRIPYSTIPEVGYEDFMESVIQVLNKGVSYHCATYFGFPEKSDIRLICGIANDENHTIMIISTRVNRKVTLHSISAHFLSFEKFEREIHENFGISYSDHPWLKPLRYSADRHDKNKTIAGYPFYSIESEELHEVGVGPIHAGIIEPGHFRFICNGEQILHLEIQLGYQHRGIEQLFITKKKLLQRATLAESIAGDTVIGHSAAFAAIWESLCNFTPDPLLQLSRTIALEHERIAIHTGDLSALSTDIAYQLGSSVFGRLRTPIINYFQIWGGNRLAKGLIRPGKTNFPFTPELAAQWLKTFEAYEPDFHEMSSQLFDLPSVLARLERTGMVSNELANSIGMVGLTGRASGVVRDIRSSHPTWFYKQLNHQPIIKPTGDVFARAKMRYDEIVQSIATIKTLIHQMPINSEPKHDMASPEPASFVISLIEGWRGEICHCAITDERGELAHYKIKDPSFHNWLGLAMAVRNNEISDFPICNKSFNLSYCGHDL